LSATESEISHINQRLIWLAIPVITGLIVPSLVIFYLEVVVGGISPSAAAADIWARQFSEGDNLFLLTLFGLIPFIALAAACTLAAGRLTSARLACFGIGGLAGILVLMVPSHYTVWYPLYGSGQTSSTAVVSFIAIPFYCLITMAFGLFVGWLVSLLPVFRPSP